MKVKKWGVRTLTGEFVEVTAECAGEYEGVLTFSSDYYVVAVFNEWSYYRLIADEKVK